MKEIRKQRFRIIKKYIGAIQELDFIESSEDLEKYPYEHEICGMEKHFIGEDSKDGKTWTDLGWDKKQEAQEANLAKQILF